MKTFIALLLLVSSTTINAQTWHTDINVAKKHAQELNKNIVLVFQGSDWCGPCIKLDREVWSTADFKAYAKKNFVLLKADFPKKKANRLSKEQQDKNDMLAEKYNQRGYFPMVAVLSPQGKVLGTTGYKKMTPTEYAKLLSSF